MGRDTLSGVKFEYRREHFESIQRAIQMGLKAHRKRGSDD
jgi:hypothetical protein